MSTGPVPSWAIPTDEEEVPAWAIPTGDQDSPSFGESLFPSATKAASEGGMWMVPKAALGVATDAFSVGSRGLAALTTDQKFSDPNAYLGRSLTPETPAITEERPNETPQDVLMRSQRNQGEKMLAPVSEFAVRTATDPLSYVGVAAKGLGAVARGAGSLAGKLNRGSGKLAQELSGVSEEALRLASTKAGRAELRNASGRQNEIGSKITDAIDDFHNNLPEKDVIDNALQNMPPVDISGAIKVLQDSKIKPASNGALLKHEREANAEIDQLIADLTGNTNGRFPKTKLSAAEAYDLRKRLDYETDFNQPYAKAVNAARFKARTQLKNDLLTAAGRSGNREYAVAMKNFADKLKVRDKLISRLGKTSNAREGRAEAFVANLFGKNSANKQETLKDLDYLFGTDLLKQSKMTFLADQLGEGGKAAILPRQTTGRSTLAATGTGMAAAIGLGSPATAAIGVPLAAHASPAVASRVVLPSLQFVEDAIQNGLVNSTRAKALAKALEKTTSPVLKARLADQLRREIEKQGESE